MHLNVGVHDHVRPVKGYRVKVWVTGKNLQRQYALPSANLDDRAGIWEIVRRSTQAEG
jgi:hypothetical protein